MHLGDDMTYIKYTSAGPNSKYEVSVAGARGISIKPTGGGTLHGTWTADNAVTSSDRRLKKSIMPLYRAISEAADSSPKSRASREAAASQLRGGVAQQTTQQLQPQQQQLAAGASRSPGSERAAAVGWVLRELRPVSFNFKDGPEAKYSRYGFIAQELQQVLPGVVRGSGEEHLKVVYQDLIALLTLAAQVLQDKVNQLSDALQKQEETSAALFKYLRELDAKVERVLSSNTGGPPPNEAGVRV